MCLLAVSRDGWALEHVKDQTPEICMAALKQFMKASKDDWDQDFQLDWIDEEIFEAARELAPENSRRKLSPYYAGLERLIKGLETLIEQKPSVAVNQPRL